jgi:hypothetical protein
MKRGADGRIFSKEAKAKLEAQATFELYQTYRRTSELGSIDQFQGLKRGRDEH